MQNMISQNDLTKLTQLQELLDATYKHYQDKGEGYGKSLEGQISLTFGTVHDRQMGNFGIETVTVYSYVFGHDCECSRRHHFDSLDKAIETVQKWHTEELNTQYDANGFVIDKES